MDETQIKNAKARADEVVNGFKRPSTQNARDAQKLAEFVILQDRQITALKRRILADDLAKATTKKSDPMSDFF
jgi:hypothetical protein